MFHFISGEIVDCCDSKATVCAQGLGIEISLTTNDLAQLRSEIGGSVRLWLAPLVSQEQTVYFGFLRRKDREFFKLLLSVSGIGGKLALSAIAQLGAEELARDIQQRNKTSLFRIKGLGKKTVERLCLDLSDSLDSWVVSSATETSQQSKERRVYLEQALGELGFPQRMYGKVLDGWSFDLDRPVGEELKSLLREVRKGGATSPDASH